MLGNKAVANGRGVVYPLCARSVSYLKVQELTRSELTAHIAIAKRTVFVYVFVFVLYCDGIACAKEGTLRKCEGRDAVSVLEPLEGLGRPVRPIPRCDARDCRTRVCVRRPLSLPLQANVISFDRHDGYQRKQSKRGCKQGEQPRQEAPGNRPRVN